MSAESIEREYPVQLPAEIRVENISGEIRVVPGGDGLARIAATKRGKPAYMENTRLKIEQSANGDIFVKVHNEDAGILGFINREVCEVDFLIEVPARMAVSVSTVEGEIEVEGMQTSVKCKGVQADIQLMDLNGRIEAQNVSGEIEVENCQGEGRFENVSGDISLEDCTFNSLSCSNVSGEIEFGGRLSKNEAHFKTISGDISLEVEEDANLTVVGKTLSGEIHTSASSRLHRKGFGTYLVEINGGGTRVHINSVSGNVEVMADRARRTKKADFEPVVPSGG